MAVKRLLGSPFGLLKMAERVGFEPTVHLLSVHSLSRRAPSASRSPLRIFNGGGSRIRTHGAFRHNGFQDRRLQPLGHPSKKRTNYNESPLRAQGPGLSIITF